MIMKTPSGTEKKKVLLVEDHPMFRERLAVLISSEPNMVVCGETDNIQDAITIAKETHPDIAIVDIALDGSSGLELIKEIKAQGLETPVLVLSMHTESLYAERAIRAGAKGYITKNQASCEVIAAVRRVLAGEIYLSPKSTDRILQRLSGHKSNVEGSGIGSLSDRELEIFQMFGKGFNTREIAEQLVLGPATIGSYRHRIKEKLRLKNAAELYSVAARWTEEHAE